MTGRNHALIVGAGLAGCATALALVRRGWSAAIVADTDPCASDIPAAVLAPPLFPGNDPVTAFRHRAGAVARTWYEHLDGSGILGRGVLLIPRRERDRRRFARLPTRGSGPLRVDPETASGLSGAQLDVECACHPGGGWFDPSCLRSTMLDAAGTEPLTAPVAALEHRRGRWHARDAEGTEIASAPVCIVAAGMGSARLLPSIASTLVAARGQATQVAASPPRIAVSGSGYAVPGADGCSWIGATIDRDDADMRARPADRARNLALYHRLWPDAPAPAIAGDFVAVRATTRDRLPLAGSLGQGLWINAGHGTQGLLSTPVTALLLARAITGGSSHPLLAQLHPARPALTRHPEPSAATLP